MTPFRTILAILAALILLGVSPASAETDLRAFKRDIKPSASLNKTPQSALRTGKKAKSLKSRKSAAKKTAISRKIAAVTTKKAKVSPDSKYEAKFAPQTVLFTGYKPGTIVIKSATKELFYVESPFRATRYRVAVGKEGLGFTGRATVGDKQEWPRWIPTADMIKRSPEKYGKYKDGMDGGPDNPLGARAIYLYQGKNDTHIRIHGTTAPQSIGTASSNGCFRMINAHVIELFEKVKMGAEVVVL
ncbi:MAG: L,D-transpeptidase [Hyphomicrobiales bacterium]|nr:L,D-transpeptidase [Hyphomicrobiales bacterium]